MLDGFAAPPRDRYQIITEHPVGHILAQDTGLGCSAPTASPWCRSASRGRPAEQKKGVYAQLAWRLEERCGVRPEDLIVSVIANERSDCSSVRIG